MFKSLRLAVFLCGMSASFAGFAAVSNSSAYVQRGLVMHWDAIDNAGVGQHNASATTWKDLTGNGFDWTLNSTWCTWSDSKLSMAVTESGSVATIPGTTTKTYKDFESKITTMEFVFKTDEYRNSIVFSPGFANREAGIAVMKDYHYIIFWDQSASSQNMWGVPLDLDEHKYTVVYTRPNGQKRPSGIEAIYVDGVKAVPVQMGNYLGQTEKPALGGRDTTWSKTVKGYIRCLRIYSYVLTPEEIALNHAIDQVRLYGKSAATVVPAGYSVDADGNFVRKPPVAVNSAFDDVKVWYKGSCGHAPGTADSGGADYWTASNFAGLKSLTTRGIGGGNYDGGAYYWWGWRLHYDNDHVKMPYAGIDLGETPCLVFPGIGNGSKTNGYVDVEIKGVVTNQPIYANRVGSFKLPNFLSDWPSGKVCSNYTCVARFKAGDPINPVPSGYCCMKLLNFGGDWNSADGGVSLTLMSTDYLSDRYRLRWTVGNTFNYQENMEFDKGRWVDLALVVESPKMTLYMCCEDGPDGAVTNKFSQFTKTFSGSPRPAIAANKRKFIIGSTGEDKSWDITYTNGVVCAQMAADFRGVFHQYAFWDRTLSIDEVREAMGRGALVRVGLVGNLGNGEFVATKTSVDAERDWEEMNPVLTTENPSATIAFTCPRQYNGLPQYLRVAACADSDAGFVEASVNGASVGQLELTPGKVASLYVGKGVVATGANTLTLTRVSGATLKLDAVTLTGSWQNGLDVTSQGIDLFGRQNDVFDSYDLTPACGDDKVHIRGTDGAAHPYTYSFRIPEDLVGNVKGKLHFRVQNTSQTLYPFETSVNGTVLSTNEMKNGSACTVSVPSRLLKAGWNEAQFKILKGWGNMDCHQFVIQPHVDGTFILLR